MSRPGWAVCLAGALLASVGTGCKDVSSYSTKPGESYCGNVIQGPFVRAGFGPAVSMRLSFDADRMTSSPGTVTTSDGAVVDAPLRVIPQMLQDPLSTLQFGDGRRKNLLYVLDPAKPGERVTAVVSLMESGEVEVRLLRAAVPPPAAHASGEPPPGDGALFGVFPLVRQEGTCGL